MNMQFWSYGQANYVADAAQYDLQGTSTVILIDVPDGFVVDNNARIVLTYAAFIITGIIRLYDFVDPWGGAYNSNFDCNSV
jgi:predicted Zn-dependent protease